MVIVGADISLNHAGYCFLDEQGKQVDYAFISDTKKEVASDPEHGYHMNVVKETGEDPLSFQLRRVKKNMKLFQDIWGRIWSRGHNWEIHNTYVAVEGYTYNVKNTNSIFQIAEMTGAIKNYVFNKEAKMRIHDPMSTKYFAVGKGRALKKEMVLAAQEDGCEFQVPIKTITVGKKTKTPYEDFDGAATDIADAYWLAKLVWMELQLRKGEIVMSDLPEHQILTFNRTTKTYPVNILARDFICIEGE